MRKIICSLINMVIYNLFIDFDDSITFDIVRRNNEKIIMVGNFREIIGRINLIRAMCKSQKIYGILNFILHK